MHFFHVFTVILTIIVTACNVGCSSAFLSRYSLSAQPLLPLSRDEKHTARFVSFLHDDAAPSKKAAAKSANGDKTSTLLLTGDIFKTSRVLATTRQEKDQLVQFFQSQQARDLLFVTDSPPDPVDPIPETMLETWKQEARLVGTTPPNGNQEVVMALCSDTIRFPGLQVISGAYSGCKYVSHSQTYEFTMIGEDTKAKGTRLQVWIFNQLLGLQNQQKKDTATNASGQNRKTTSAGRVSLVDTADGMLVRFTSSFQIRIQVPSLVLRMLPISVDKVEDQAAAQIRNFVERDVDASIARLEEAFEDAVTSNEIVLKPQLTR